MMHASDLADALGRKEMAKGLGVGVKAISNAVANDRFPTAWFDTLEAMARERGVECPRSLFGWRKAQSDEDVA